MDMVNEARAELERLNKRIDTAYPYELVMNLADALEISHIEVERLEAVNNIIGIECVGHQEKYRIYREENAELRARISKLEVEISLAVAAPKWDLMP
jgi:hypothetical protein